MTTEKVKIIKENENTIIEVYVGSTYKGVEVYTNIYKNWGDMGWNRVLEKIKNIKDELFLNKDNAGTIIELLTK